MLLSKAGLQPAYISVFRSYGTERLRRSACRALRGLQLGYPVYKIKICYIILYGR